jgi:hypothetical protein
MFSTCNLRRNYLVVVLRKSAKANLTVNLKELWYAVHVER